MILIHVCGVEGNQLRYPQTAGEKQHQDRIVPIRIGPVTGRQKTLALRFFQIPRQRRLTLGHVKFLTNIVVQQMALERQVIEEGFDRGGTAAAAGGGETAGFKLRRKRLIAIQFFDPDAFDEIEIDIGDVDLIERNIARHKMTAAFQITKQDFQIVIVS